MPICPTFSLCFFSGSLDAAYKTNSSNWPTGCLANSGSHSKLIKWLEHELAHRKRQTMSRPPSTWCAGQTWARSCIRSAGDHHQPASRVVPGPVSVHSVRWFVCVCVCVKGQEHRFRMRRQEKDREQLLAMTRPFFFWFSGGSALSPKVNLFIMIARRQCVRECDT